MALHIDVRGERGDWRFALEAWCDGCNRPMKGAGILVLPDAARPFGGGIGLACSEACATARLGDDWSPEEDVWLPLSRFLRMLPDALDIDMDAEAERELDELLAMRATFERAAALSGRTDESLTYGEAVAITARD